MSIYTIWIDHGKHSPDLRYNQGPLGFHQVRLASYLLSSLLLLRLDREDLRGTDISTFTQFPSCENTHRK